MNVGAYGVLGPGILHPHQIVHPKKELGSLVWKFPSCRSLGGRLQLVRILTGEPDAAKLV